MNLPVRLFALYAFLTSGAAWADGGTSCATAQELFGNQVYTGDTSTSTNFIGNFSGPPSPGPDLAFKFTMGFGGAFGVTITGGWNAGGVVVATCGPVAGPPLAAGTGTTTFSVPLTNLVAGTEYYFIMTGNPSDNTGPSGAFSLVTPPWPVTLQSFSVD